MSFKWKNKTYEQYDQIIDAALALQGEEQRAFVEAYCATGEFARQNIGYFSGYYTNDRRLEILRVFETSHPIFGVSAITKEEAFALGQKLAAEKQSK
jgi:hypothetical protein